MIHELKAQMEAIGRTIWPLLSEKEKPTFEVRPAVSLGDIEIFLNGRFWPIEMDHFEKVMQENGVESHVKHLLTRLRGHQYMFDSENDPTKRGKYQFTHENVLREVNYVLLTLCNGALKAEDEERITKRIEKAILKIFKVRKQARKNAEFTTAEYKVINKILIDELSTILNEKKSNG